MEPDQRSTTTTGWQLQNPDSPRPTGEFGRVLPTLRRRVRDAARAGRRDDCWQPRGRAELTVDGRKLPLPGLVYHLEHGRWPDDLGTTCGGSGCVNPFHLVDKADDAAMVLTLGRHPQTRLDYDDDGRRVRPDPAPVTRIHRPTDLRCPMCKGPMPVARKGPLPKWCSQACRQRASERRRAAADGQLAVEVVDRVKTVMVTPRTAQEWADELGRLTRLLDAGRIYDRDLPVLQPALAAAVAAINRRL